MSSRACPRVRAASRIQLPVNDVGEPPFEASHRFFVALALGSLPQVIGPTGGVLTNLGKGHDMQAEVELAVAGAGEPVADNISGGHVDRGGAGVGGERGGGAESIDGADAAEDLARRQGTDLHSSVRVVPEAVTAAWDVVSAALAMRRSSWRISATRSVASPAQDFAGGIAGTDPGRSSAARSAVRSRWAPAGMRLVSTTWRRLMVWVRVLTRSSRCSTIARRAVHGPVDRGGISTCLRSQRGDPHTPRRRRRRSCGRDRSTASAPGRRVSREHRRRRSRRCVAALSVAHPGRMRLRSPRSGRATGPRSGAARGSRRG